MELMDYGIAILPLENAIIKKINPITLEETDIINLDIIFNGDSLEKTTNEVKELYTQNGKAQVITEYEFTPAEMILGNIYKDTFDTKEDSIYTIKNNPDYFLAKIKEEFIPITNKIDFKISLKNGNNPIYVKYVDSLPESRKNEEVIDSFEIYGDSMKKMLTRLGKNGETLYVLPEDSVLHIVDGVDTLYIKIGTYNSSNKTIEIKQDFKRNLKNFIKSFKGEVSSIVPYMNNHYNNVILNKHSYNLDGITYNIFSNFHNYKNNNISINNKFLVDNYEDIVRQIANKKRVS